MGYAALTGVAWAFRGANWAWTDAWRTSPSSLVVAPVFATPDPAGEPLRGRALPVVMGRPEGCLVCHAGVTGLSESHDPATIGCASCHLGNVFSLDAKTAHAGMHVVPGNLAHAGRTCGGECHQSIVTRVERSLMSTNAGIVAGESCGMGGGESRRAQRAHIRQIGHSPADTHLRQLCASCHLGLPKTEPWPITEESRGGGCTACHVSYSPEAFAALERYRADRSAWRRGGAAGRASRRRPGVGQPAVLRLPQPIGTHLVVVRRLARGEPRAASREWHGRTSPRRRSGRGPGVA